MPGIAGIIGAGVSTGGPAPIERMVEVMRHESFYAIGTRREERVHAAVGWAVHKGSFADGGPVWNDAGDMFLVFTGEDFSSRDGERSESARYLIDRYEAQGPRFLEQLNGTFAGLLVDLRRDTVLLFNDRHGLSRIYWHGSGDAFYFSSEAKSILSVVPETRAIDDQGLAEFASSGCAMQDRTLFRNISLLPPASCWTFCGGKLSAKRRYFRKETWEQLPALGEAEYYERLREIFPAVVQKYFRGRPKVGMSLTGGLDGRMIMACSGHREGELPCYTFGGVYRDCTDVTLARQVARNCGQPHQVIVVDEAFLEQFGVLAEKSVYISDGAMDVTGAVELFANMRARSIAPVRMTGNYGSEILRSNVAFKASPLSPRLFNPEFVRAGEGAIATYRAEACGRRLSLIAAKQVPWHHHSRLAVEQSQVTMRSPYLDDELVRLAYQSPTGQEESKTPALRFIDEGTHGLGRIPTDRGLLYRPRPVATSLGNLFQEFMFKAEYAYDYGMPQWLAKVDRLLKPVRPERLFLGRHKFYHFRVWYRDRLAGYLRDVLLDPGASRRSHLEPGRLRSLVQEHLAGTHNHTTALHQALSIELIYRKLVERRW